LFFRVLERLNVRCLPALRPLYDVELNGLALLKALEAIRDNGGVMYKDIFAVLPRNKAETLRVVKPFYGTLFHVMLFLFGIALERTEPISGRILLVGEVLRLPGRF
jgi:hypothetical protein